MDNIDLEREYFQFDVKIFNGTNGKYAKWENNKHPDNPEFMQIVNWYAYIANDNVLIRYYLDKTNIGNNHLHDIIPINGRAFEDIIFEYWKSN